ncbi:MAG: twin-arginine translocation signal domain-containing protein [Granulosicoccus sp.]
MSQKKEGESSKPTFIDANRRGFLQGAAIASGVAATGVASATDALEAPTDRVEASAQGKGYELTDHVKKYYKRARF